ncbi:MAG: sugar transferase [Bacteroidetes bacterium]|nr:sugar transferase [Bacteroidota bacterium]
MNSFLIRFFDLLFSLCGLIILSPVFLIISVFVIVGSKGGVLFLQNRVGKNGVDFTLWKFRTMRIDSEKTGQITVGKKDPRITGAGYFLRKFKLDELPQLVNVLVGQMSLVGPRPEVRKYVDLYSEKQRKVLTVKPGITDYASIEYADENELLGKSTDPLKTYVEEIMPDKIILNMKYIDHPTIGNYFCILAKTLLKIF